jgi:hypothetical protein
MRDEGAKITRTKWWKLKGEAQQTFRERMIKKGPWGREGGADNMRMKMTTCIHKVDSEALGMTMCKKHEGMDTW